MKKQIEVENKTITLFCRENDHTEVLPIVILNTFDEDGETIWNKVKELSKRKCILAVISNINWNQEMSPWYMDRLYKKEEDYEGKAGEYLSTLMQKIIPEIEKAIYEEWGKRVSYYTLAGYSLAGLFALYSLYQTDLFQRIVSCSGSLWYPNFIEYTKINQLKAYPDKIYLSLGNKESKTKNELMATVEKDTKYLAEYFKSKGIQTIYEENEGNHFQEVTARIAKGICWIIE